MLSNRGSRKKRATYAAVHQTPEVYCQVKPRLAILAVSGDGSVLCCKWTEEVIKGFKKVIWRDFLECRLAFVRDLEYRAGPAVSGDTDVEAIDIQRGRNRYE